MAYSGRFIPRNKDKYAGDFDKITYRSLWERNVMKWMDENPDVVKWESEETVVPYVCKTDGRPHRYFMDFNVTFKSGKTFLIEVKPKVQTTPPVKKSNRATPRYIKEVMTFAKNTAKWKAADKYAKDRGWIFQIWTEETLNESLGIKTGSGKYIKKGKK